MDLKDSVPAVSQPVCVRRTDDERWVALETTWRTLQLDDLVLVWQFDQFRAEFDA
jgi:hypothetical protein